MANYNKIILVGNLTRDPALTYTANNTAVCETGIAVNRKWKGPDGQDKEDVLFIDCKVFGKSAETFQKYTAKGKPILIEGRLQLQQWQSQDGQKRSKHVIVVDSFQFLSSGDRTQGAPAASASSAPPAQEAPAFDDDSIPF